MVSFCRGVLTATCLAGLAMMTAACDPMVDQRGWRVDDAAVASIKPGVDNKDSVLRVLGSPSSTSNFNDQTWYYISQTTSHLPFERDHSVDQQVTAVEFDTNGNVTDIHKIGADAGRQVAMNSDQTHFLGTNTNLWQELFGNIGRFNTPNSGTSIIPGGATPGNPNGY